METIEVERGGGLYCTYKRFGEGEELMVFQLKKIQYITGVNVRLSYGSKAWLLWMLSSLFSPNTMYIYSETYFSYC